MTKWKIIFVTTCLLCSTAWANDLKNCEDSDDQEQIIRACTNLIKSKKWGGERLAEIFVHRGAAYFREDEYNLAVQDFTHAVRLQPDNADYHGALGLIFSYLGRYEEGLKSRREAIRLEPNNANHHIGTSFTLNMLQRYDEGLEEAEKAIQLDPPGYAYAHGNKAFSLGHLGRYEEALAAARESVRLGDGNAANWAMLGFAENLVGSYQESVAAFERAVVLDPDYFDNKDPEHRAQLKSYKASLLGRQYQP